MVLPDIDPGSSIAYYGSSYDAQARPLTFRGETPADWTAWRAALRGKLTELLRLTDQEPVPLDPRVIAEVDAGSYMRRTVVFTSEPGMDIPAYLLVPKSVTALRPVPGILTLHGHGRGRDDVAGIAAGRRERQARISALNYDYAHRLASLGYVVLAPDIRGFGELARDGMTCAWSMAAALMVGKVLVGLRVWDTMRAIDVLQQTAGVRPDRIGCVGFSWGGTHTMYTAALDDRVGAAVISGTFGTFRDALLDAGECTCQYVPDLLRWCELPDIVAAIAPRPVLIEQGRNDQHYSLDTVEPACAAVRRVYALAGADDGIALDLHDGNHTFSGRYLPEFLRRNLGPGASHHPLRAKNGAFGH